MSALTMKPYRPVAFISFLLGAVVWTAEMMISHWSIIFHWFSKIWPQLVAVHWLWILLGFVWSIECLIIIRSGKMLQFAKTDFLWEIPQMLFPQFLVKKDGCCLICLTSVYYSALQGFKLCWKYRIFWGGGRGGDGATLQTRQNISGYQFACRTAISGYTAKIGIHIHSMQKNRAYSNCVSTNPFVRFLVFCSTRYMMRKRELLHVICANLHRHENGKSCKCHHWSGFSVNFGGNSDSATVPNIQVSMANTEKFVLFYFSFLLAYSIIRH